MKLKSYCCEKRFLLSNLIFDKNVLICYKLLLLSVALVIVGQFEIVTHHHHPSSISLISGVYAAYGDQCKNFEIIKPPRFGKRSTVFFYTLNGCGKQKRNSNGGFYNHQKLKMDIISYLYKKKPINNLINDQLNS